MSDAPTTFDYETLGSSSLSRTKSYALKANHIDQTYLIDVAMPAASVAPGQTLPVVYVLDGNDMFAMTTQIARGSCSQGSIRCRPY